MHHGLAIDLQDERWRTRAIVLSALAGLELVILLFVAIALLGKPVSQKVAQAAEAKVLAPPKPAAAKPKPKPKPKPPAARIKLSRAETRVTILNGNGVSGAAHAAAEQVRVRGYAVGTVGNAPRRDFTHTMVMYRKGYRPEAERLARDVGAQIVTPLDGLTTSDLTGSHLALIVGA